MPYRAMAPDAADGDREVVFPDEGQVVTIPQEYETRWVGEQTTYTVPAGATGTVVGNWEECCDTHVLVHGDPAEPEVWVCPLDLEFEGKETT